MKGIYNLIHILVFVACKILKPSQKELKALRAKAESEISFYKYDIDNIKDVSLLIDNKCGLINTEGVCYFNAVIQSLFSNRKFVLFYLMNDFDDDQVLSKNLQGILCKMLRSKNIDPIPYLLNFSQHQRLLNHCTINGGNPLVLLEELLIGLYSEIDNKENLLYMEGAPQNYFITERYTTTCKKCLQRTVDEISNVTLNVPFSNTIEESLSFYKNIRNTGNANKYYKCSSCVLFNPIVSSDIKHEIKYPNHLVLVFERVQIKNNVIYSIFQEMTLNQEIEIDGNKYRLYSAICSYMLKKGYHANAIVWKDSKWVLFNDNQLEIFQPNRVDSSIFNNYAWILFYRKVV